MTACDRRTDLANQTNVMSTDDFGDFFLANLCSYSGYYGMVVNIVE